MRFLIVGLAFSALALVALSTDKGYIDTYTAIGASYLIGLLASPETEGKSR